MTWRLTAALAPLLLVLTGCIADLTPGRLAAMQADPAARDGQRVFLRVYPYDLGHAGEGLMVACLSPCPQGPDASNSVLLSLWAGDYAGWRGDRLAERQGVVRLGCPVEGHALCERYGFYIDEIIVVT